MEATILKALFEAKTGMAVKAIIDKYLSDSQFTWRSVGDRENNYGTIGIASDALISLVERITNCIDATFEKYVLQNEKWKTIRSPREFAEKVVGFKGSKISPNIKMRVPEPQDNTGIIVEVQSGDNEDVSTIDVLDKGIGLSRSEIPDTILSLNKNNKIEKWYLMGRYGQGGSTSLKFSDYTIIITKQHDAGEIAFTIVRYEPPKEDEKDGKYTYVVRSYDRLPLSVNASDASFFLECNTLVRNINYGIGKQSTPLLSIYGKLDYRLFDPVLPYKFILKTGSRQQPRTMYGSRDRLNRTELVDQKNEIEVPLVGFGKITIRYWVFGKDVTRQQKLTFVEPEKPIVITIDGQTHSVLPRSILLDCKLPYLKDSLVVQVECDDLNVEGRHRFVPSTREALTSEGENLIKNKIIKTLSTLNELKSLNKIREDTYETKYFSKDLEVMKRKLAEMINRFSAGKTKISGGVGPDGDRTPVKNTYDEEKDDEEEEEDEDIELQTPDALVTRDPPTFIRISNKSNPLIFRQNRMTRINIETDAPDNYLLKVNKDFTLSEETEKYVSISHKQADIRNGGIFLYLRLNDGITPSTSFEFRISLPIDDTKVLEDGRLALVKKPILKRPGEGAIQANSPNVEPVDRDHPYYKDNQWDENTVADVKKGSENMTIYVSVENKWLREELISGKYSEVRRKSIQNRYVVLMAFNAYFADKFKEQREKENFEFADNHVQELFETGTRTILYAITSEKALELKYET